MVTPITETAKSPTGVPYFQNGKPTSYTGITTPEGVTNPYTGGTETASPKGTLFGVNEGIYSPKNKQDMWTKAGLSGTYDPNAFFRGEGAEMTIKPEYLKTATPTVSTPTVSVPSATTPAPTPTTAPVTTPVTTPQDKAKAAFESEEKKTQDERTKAINDAYDAYNVTKGEYQKNSSYYTNWNDVDTMRDNVLSDVKNAMMAKGE